MLFNYTKCNHIIRRSMELFSIVQYSSVKVPCVIVHGKFEPIFYCCSLYVPNVYTAPTVQVSRVNVERVISNKSALVCWTPLTLNQARGFPMYFATYQPSSVQASGRCYQHFLLWTLAQQGANCEAVLAQVSEC